MDQRKTTKESINYNQVSIPNQSTSQDLFFIEEEANRLYNQVQKTTSEFKAQNGIGSLGAISLEEFITTSNFFFDSPFTDVADKKILFAAFAMIHQYYLCANSFPIFEHMLPFSTLWDTFGKAFNLLDFSSYKSKIDEGINKIKLILDDSKEKTQEDSFVDDHDEIVATFTLLFQCFESIDSEPNNKLQSIEKCSSAIDNINKYINEIQSISMDSIHEIQIQLIILQKILKSYQKFCSMANYINKINNVMSTIPSTFDDIKSNSSSNYFNDITVVSKILKSILDFYSVYFKLMVNITDWKEAKSLFMCTQEMYMIIDQPFASSFLTPNAEVSKLIKTFSEKVQLFTHDRSFKDTLLLKELSSAINVLPSELFHIRSSLASFLSKRREVSIDCNDTQRMYSVYQACINFSSLLRPSNGPIYNITYKLLQTYSRALINSIIFDSLDTSMMYLARINLSNVVQPKMIESTIGLEMSTMLKLSQDFVSCRIVSDKYKDFMDRVHLLLFFLKNAILKIPSNAISKALPTLLSRFPNFIIFRISKSFLCKDLNALFQSGSEKVIEQISQFESEGNSDNFQGIKKSIDSIQSAFGHYGQIIKSIDLDTLNQFNKYFRFKKCLEEFTNFLPKEDKFVGNELYVIPNEFIILFESFLEKMQEFISEKLISDLGVIKLCYDITLLLLYRDSAIPEAVLPKYLKLLKNLNICSFKQKLQISFRYIELFNLMKNDNEIEGEDTENIISNFGDAFILFCSQPVEDSYKKIFSLFPLLKNFISNCDFSYFENMFDISNKFNNLLTDLNQINSIFFPPSDYKNEFNTYEIIVFSNLIESFNSIFEKFIFYKLLSKESADIVKKIINLLKDFFPISLFSYLIYSNPNLEKYAYFDSNEFQAEMRKEINLYEFIKNLADLLSDMLQNVKFTDYQKIIKDELSIYSSMFRFYSDFCPEVKFLEPHFNEFVQLSDQIMINFIPISYRMLKIINIIYLSLKQIKPVNLEITALFQITQKAHSLVLNALSINSIDKDLKIILNNLFYISKKHKVDYSQTMHYYPTDDYFNYSKINSEYIKNLYTVLQELYEYDSSRAKSPDELEFSDIYSEITSSLPLLNSLFDKSTLSFVKNFFIDGCKRVDYSSKKLESSIASIANKIIEEKRLLNLPISDETKSIKNDDGDTTTTEMKENSSSINEPGLQTQIEEGSLESIVNLYKSILDKKIKQNKLHKENIDELRVKIDEHKDEFIQTNQELTKYTQLMIPTEFSTYSTQTLEPLKNFQSQETEKSEASKTTGSNDDDSQFDIFSGSEFNSMFVNTILMKIEELDQQNIALSRYINIQEFYSTVDEYIKNQKKNSESTENHENESKEIETKTEATIQQISNENENDNDNDNNDNDDAKIGDDENADEYEYEYEYVDDDDKKGQYDEFEQEEIKLIMMINSLRNCGKNKSTLKEIVSSNYKESISKIELEFYRLIEKAGALFNVDHLEDDDDGQNENAESFADLFGNSQRGSKFDSIKGSDRKKNLLKFAKSMVQKNASDDS